MVLPLYVAVNNKTPDVSVSGVVATPDALSVTAVPLIFIPLLKKSTVPLIAVFATVAVRVST